jgi:DNA (cytosine-5)-methyltransferase 1
MLTKFKLGSLFDGSGGFPLAGALCGIEPVWASEVEPYPIAVTRSRFPNMKHLGDISKVNGADIEPVDIITFGSPCQDLSVAGKRAGLKHEANGDEETTRSGLFMEAVRIIKEMRRATNGIYPTFAIWENVPGAFSSNSGEDFRIVCEELIKIVEPSASMPSVPQNGWNYADSYVGDGWSLAYRVFDAQYWGVPQRRRRIYLVADFRGERAREVLFEREGLRGYFATGRTPWQAAPSDAEGSLGADYREGEDFDGYNGELTGDKAATLGVNCGVSTGRNGVIERGRLDAIGFDSYNLCETGDKGRTITTPSGGLNEHIPYVRVCVGLDAYNQSLTGDKAKTMGASATDTDHTPCVVYDARGNGDGSTVNTITGDHENRITDYTSVVLDPKSAIPIHDQATRFSGKRGDKADGKGNGLGIGEAGDPMNTLTGGDRHAVAFLASGKETTGTLMANAGTKLWLGNLEAFSGDYSIIEEHPSRYIVRRLTPTECARLQGFADRWGHIEPKDTLTDEEYRFWQEVRNTHAAINGKKVQDYTPKQMLTWYNKLWTDSAEYKMWGNGIAFPTALYCVQGVAEALMNPIEAEFEAIT